ncbi:MAG: hypothetical protein ABIS45_08760 [Burkholderiales bacterium]
MHCTLLIPDLLPPRELGAEAFAGLRTAALSELLARASVTTTSAIFREDWLCDGFGAKAQQDRPLAALLLQADGGAPAHDYWLCADPIHLRVDRNRLIIAGRAADFSADETRDLIAALNGHFGADGLEFRAPVPHRWYVRVPRVPQLVTTPLAQALNQSVKHHLPRGADALSWHGVMNEAQMILHAHPVTAAREARGASVANSIWLSGGGTIPSIARPIYAAAWGGGPLLHALAAGAGIAHDELPAGGRALLEHTAGDRHLLEIGAAADALREYGPAAWREAVMILDEQWIRPLLDALRTRRLDELTIVACNRDALLEATLTRAQLRRFWRRSRPLSAYAT